jgi:hypothetical protein
MAQNRQGMIYRRFLRPKYDAAVVPTIPYAE